MRKLIAIILFCWGLSLIELYGQTWGEKVNSIMLSEEPDSLSRFLRMNQTVLPLNQKNDTSIQIAGVIDKIAQDYENNKLGGHVDYSQSVYGFKLILIQPEVEVCLFDDLDYRSILSKEYDTKSKAVSLRDKSSGLSGAFPSVYQQIPGTKKVKRIKFSNKDYEYVLRMKRSLFLPVVMLDKSQLSFLRKSLSKHKKHIDWERMKKVLDVSFSEKDGRVSLSYSFWVDKLIFNKERDVCIAQFSTKEASYEALLMRLEDSDEWKIVRNTEMYYRKDAR